MCNLRILIAAFVLGASANAFGATQSVSVGGVTFKHDMPQAQALELARQALAVVHVDGTEKYFLYAKNKDGKAVGSPLGGISFDKSKLSVIRRDLGSLNSPEALTLGRKIATSIAESGFRSDTKSVLSQAYREFSTATTNTIELRLPDRLLRIVVYESTAPGTESSLDVTEHFGGSQFD